MKLNDIWESINFGDVILYQQISNGVYNKPKLITIVGKDTFNSSIAVYYVDYKSFKQHLSDTHPKYKKMEVTNFCEYNNEWYILGYWGEMPNFKQLINRYRKWKQ